VVAVHNWQLALFPQQAQDEVWGKDTSVLISSSYAPTGKIERVEGGFKVSGRWSFSSGSDHCQWVFLGGFAPVGPDEKPDMRTYLLPRSDYKIEDTWHVMGLKGTGSKDIVVDGAFVPEYRTHKLIDGYLRKSPGNELNPAPLFRLPFGQIFVRSVSTTSIGIAQGALDSYREVTSQRFAASTGSKIAEDPTAQIVAAHAASVIDEMKLVLYRNFDEMMTTVRAGKDLSVDRRVQFRYESSLVVDKCVGIIDDLFTASGGRAIFLSSPIQRFFLDIHTARAHYANNPDKPGRNFGAVQLKQKNTDFFI
jgi:3-hydroxy-9,10-secoandrosta-1,3,5(10)-triene-9,17-dione monooxygenase